MGKAIEELAHFAALTPWETIPEALRSYMGGLDVLPGPAARK